MLSIDKTHALSDRKMQKTARFVILLYFLPITHPPKLLNWRFGVSRWSLRDERNFGRDFNSCRRVFTFVNIAGSTRPSPPPRPLWWMVDKRRQHHDLLAHNFSTGIFLRVELKHLVAHANLDSLHRHLHRHAALLGQAEGLRGRGVALTPAGRGCSCSTRCGR